jgi:hypothetical protein
VYHPTDALWGIRRVVHTKDGTHKGHGGFYFEVQQPTQNPLSGHVGEWREARGGVKDAQRRAQRGYP